MNRRHAAKIAQLTATVRTLAARQAPITVLDINGDRAHGYVTDSTDAGFVVRSEDGLSTEAFEFALLESVGTYNA